MTLRAKAAFCFASAAFVMACHQGIAHDLAADGGAVAGCSAGGGCGALAATRWAGVFGISVAWAGAAVYGALAALLVLRPVSFGWTRALAWSVAGAALWFVSLQAVLGKFCVLCCVTHGLGLAAALQVLLVLVPQAAAATGSVRSGVFGGRGWLGGAVPGLLMTAVLALTQALQPAPASSRVAVLADSAAVVGSAGPETAAAGQGKGQAPSGAAGLAAAGAFYFPVRNVTGQLEFPGAGRFPVQDFPKIGSVGANSAAGGAAAVPALLLFDWTCGHCREVQGLLASRKAGGAAFLLVPGHTSDEGREIHRQLLTAFYADPAGYAEISTALLSGGMAASPESVKAAMEKRLGARRWEKSLAGTAAKVNALITLGDALMNRTAATLKASSLPQIISPRAVLTGTPEAAKLDGFLADLPAQAARAAEQAEAVEKDQAQRLALAAAGGAGAAAAQKPTEGAVLRFASQTFNSEPVAQGEVAHLEVHFDNPGTAPLKILSCNGGCGCVTLSGVEQTVPPGGKGSFKVDYKTAGQRVGTSTRSLRIYSAAANVPANQPSFVSIAVPVTPPNGTSVAAAAAAAAAASSSAAPRRSFAVSALPSESAAASPAQTTAAPASAPAAQ